MAENRTIGRDGGMPWHLPADLKHFKAVTMGHPVVMGRKTWESIGRPLPGRRNVIVTRNPDFRPSGAETAPDLTTALQRCRDTGAEAAMVIGGGEIYAQAMPLADRIELTEIHAHIDGDTAFPAIDPALWRETRRVRQPAAPDGTAFSFVTLERR